jgi:hypothetical protein
MAFSKPRRSGGDGKEREAGDFADLHLGERSGETIGTV